MRILIIAQPRTGSTVFSRWLSSELNFKWINEPFNITNHNINDIFDADNIVVKLIFENNTGEWFWDGRIKSINHLISLNWDIIFVLTRDNTLNQAISKAWADENEMWGETKYRITDGWLEKRNKGIQKRIVNIEKDKEFLKLLNVNQITYEGIYETKCVINELKELLKVNDFKYTDVLSNKNRYRKTAEYNEDDLFDKFKKKSYIRVI
jgi:LPS sulfotransferase NodH